MFKRCPCKSYTPLFIRAVRLIQILRRWENQPQHFESHNWLIVESWCVLAQRQCKMFILVSTCSLVETALYSKLSEKRLSHEQGVVVFFCPRLRIRFREENLKRWAPVHLSGSNKESSWDITGFVGKTVITNRFRVCAVRAKIPSRRAPRKIYPIYLKTIAYLSIFDKKHWFVQYRTDTKFVEKGWERRSAFYFFVPLL